MNWSHYSILIIIWDSDLVKFIVEISDEFSDKLNVPKIYLMNGAAVAHPPTFESYCL